MIRLDDLKPGTKLVIKAWDHNISDQVETVATYNGWCDHPEWGAAVSVSYENTDCHIDETETDIPVRQFEKNIIKLAEVA